MTPSPAHLKAQEFLKVCSEFQLGALPTEQSHSRTKNLSALARADLRAALRLLHEVELTALSRSLLPELAAIDAMAAEMSATFASGGRVFFCGCGATGRLSLALEFLWREQTARRFLGDRSEDVIAFMAGGDYALVRSIENFEDHPEFGARQLNDLGFSANDLLIASTEGGETPFVIGATEEAAKLAKRPPYFLYCNPTAILVRTVQRSRRMIENPGVRSLCLDTGPMALTGSTRLQASTALMLAAGSALLSTLETSRRASDLVKSFRDTLADDDFTGLATIIEREAEIYQRGEHCIHEAAAYALTVLTDTAERSPTFSLLPFENAYDPDFGRPETWSWTYVAVPGASNAGDAWRRILHRPPRALDWKGFSEKFGGAVLHGFDFSPGGAQRRSRRFGAPNLHTFSIMPVAATSVQGRDARIVFSLDEISATLPRPEDLLHEHLILKVALNMISTLVMGRLGRFHQNLMLYVKSSNYKLVDRSIRFVKHLLTDPDGLKEPKGPNRTNEALLESNETGLDPWPYDEICKALFEVLETLPPGESAVLHTFALLSRRRPPGQRRRDRS